VDREVDQVFSATMQSVSANSSRNLSRADLNLSAASEIFSDDIVIGYSSPSLDDSQNQMCGSAPVSLLDRFATFLWCLISIIGTFSPAKLCSFILVLLALFMSLTSVNSLVLPLSNVSNLTPNNRSNRSNPLLISLSVEDVSLRFELDRSWCDLVSYQYF